MNRACVCGAELIGSPCRCDEPLHFPGTKNRMILPASKEPITLRQLHQAFDLVKPRPHWKDPIDRWVDLENERVPGVAVQEQVDLITEAVTWFTGSVPEFFYAAGSTTRVRVLAAGYYAAVGA